MAGAAAGRKFARPWRAEIEVFACSSTAIRVLSAQVSEPLWNNQAALLQLMKVPLVKLVQPLSPAKRSSKKDAIAEMQQAQVRLLARGEATLEELGCVGLPCVETIQRLLPDDGCANSSGSDPIVYTDASIELRVRQICAYYGLERLPLTVAELQGLQDYVLMFAPVRADVGSMPAEMRASWELACLQTCKKVRPEWADAMKLFIARDDVALATHHRKAGTVSSFARRYREFGETGA